VFFQLLAIIVNIVAMAKLDARFVSYVFIEFIALVVSVFAFTVILARTK
jgi:hypothetical protein